MGGETLPTDLFSFEIQIRRSAMREPTNSLPGSTVPAIPNCREGGGVQEREMMVADKGRREPSHFGLRGLSVGKPSAAQISSHLLPSFSTALLVLKIILLIGKKIRQVVQCNPQQPADQRSLFPSREPATFPWLSQQEAG